MTEDDIRNRLLSIFLEELEDRVDNFNRILLEAEESDGDISLETVDELFRESHSLKGAARAVDLRDVERFCHALEDILDKARKEEVDLDSAWIQFLFSVIDTIEEAGERIRNGRRLEDSRLKMALPEIERTARELPEAPPQLATAESVVVDDREPIEDVDSFESKRRASDVETEADGHTSRPETGRTSGRGRLRLSSKKLDSLMSETARLRSTYYELRSVAAESRRLRQRLFQWDEAHWRESEARRAQAYPREEVEDAVYALAEQLTRQQRALERQVEQLTDEVEQVRMLPFRDACQGLDRLVRDLARQTDKQVELAIEGGDVELDRAILDGLRDPLMQLVRNAIYHGIEPPEERRASGKSTTGTVTISARPRGGSVEIAVTDDGRGIDWSELRRRALADPSFSGGEDAGHDDLREFLFRSGVSTRSTTDEVSGRGVGLDVVRTRLRDLRGHVDLYETDTAGLRVVMSVPLTLMTLTVVLVRAGGGDFAVPLESVDRVVERPIEAIRTVEDREMFPLDDELVPLISLAHLLGLETSRDAGSRLGILVAETGRRRVGLAVSALLSEREITVKSLGSRLRGISHVVGGSILPDGRISMILNIDSLLREHTEEASRRKTVRESREETGRGRILLVDDSVTTRTFQKSILESAGYVVDVAADGARAQAYLDENKPDAVVSDVEMPAVDGFELTRWIRSEAQLRDLPVVLVTGLEKEEEREEGLHAGADAYLVKSHIDASDLLQALEQLI